MRVLALDTTTRAGSAALVSDDRVVDERSGDGTRTHALRMPGEILEIAAANQWPLADIDLYAVATGPGSFTGLRIGLATMQGLALVNGRRIVGVTVLEALAQAAASDAAEGAVIAAWMDAHRQDVFAALYRVTAAAPFSPARVVELDGASVGSPAATLERWRGAGLADPDIFIGDGAVLYHSQLEEMAARSVVRPSPLLAGTIGRVAFARKNEALEPAAVRPFYVRRPDVEVTRDKNVRATGTKPKHT